MIVVTTPTAISAPRPDRPLANTEPIRVIARDPDRPAPEAGSGSRSWSSHCDSVSSPGHFRMPTLSSGSCR